MSRAALLLLASVLIACPPSLGDDDDATANDDDATANDDDDATANDDDATMDDDDATMDDDDATMDDDDATMDDDDSTADDDDSSPETSFCWAGVTESEILAAVYGGPKVPPGYWSDTATNAAWWSPCSSSLSDTQSNAAAQYPQGTLTGNDQSTPWFHEAEVQLSTAVRYRNTRCDWWDGTTLAGAPFTGWAELQELVGYLWWTDNHNFGGAHIVGGVGNVGGATNFFSLCHVTTVYGDWGLQDEITVWQTEYGILQNSGDVTPYAAQQMGVVLGNWN